MAEIQVPEISRALRRRFGITEATIAPSMAPEIVPVVLVADLTDESVRAAYLERAAELEDSAAERETAILAKVRQRIT